MFFFFKFSKKDSLYLRLKQGGSIANQGGTYGTDEERGPAAGQRQFIYRSCQVCGKRCAQDANAGTGAAEVFFRLRVRKGRRKDASV